MFGPCSVYVQSLVLSTFRLCSVPIPVIALSDKFWLYSVYVTVCVPSLVLSAFSFGSVHIPDLFHQICSLIMLVWLWCVQKHLSFDAHNQPPGVSRGGLSKGFGQILHCDQMVLFKEHASEHQIYHCSSQNMSLLGDTRYQIKYM